jgi:phospholipid/cholesterol/gamma-HCH transport system substrate-binding protein
MDERVVEFRVGVMVLVSVVIAGVMVLLFREQGSVLEGTREVQISLDSARGVAAGTPVRKRGILVGRVKRVVLDDENKRVMLTAEIDSGVQIYKDEICRLRTSLMGDAELEIVPRDASTGGQESIASDVEVSQT